LATAGLAKEEKAKDKGPEKHKQNEDERLRSWGLGWEKVSFMFRITALV